MAKCIHIFYKKSDLSISPYLVSSCSFARCSLLLSIYFVRASFFFRILNLFVFLNWVHFTSDSYKPSIKCLCARLLAHFAWLPISANKKSHLINGDGNDWKVLERDRLKETPYKSIKYTTQKYTILKYFACAVQ